MKSLAALLIVFTGLAAGSNAIADSTSVGTTMTFDREARDLSRPKDAKIEFNASHTFDNEVFLGGSADYSNAASSTSATENLEGIIGYRLRINNAFSMTGSAGIGERFQVSGPGGDFPYYVIRAATDLELTKEMTWNAVTFRYRDSFDASDDYLTPQLATGITFKIGEHDSFSGKFGYNWKDWNPDSVAFSIGYKHTFRSGQSGAD